MARRLIWTENPKFEGFGCSECPWVFTPFGPPIGITLEAMKRDYEIERDKEFSKHVCKSRRKSSSRPAQKGRLSLGSSRPIRRHI
jgi:hypothetical protein